MVKFGFTSLPSVLSITEGKRRNYVQKIIPGRDVAYRVNIGGEGRTWEIAGVIMVPPKARPSNAGKWDSGTWDNATWGDNLQNMIRQLELLADDTIRPLDFEDGLPPVNAIMTDFEPEQAAGKPFSAPYRAFFSEVNNP